MTALETSKVRLEALKSELADEWRRILTGNALVRRMLDTPIDRRIYALYMTETFHYTRHNARNQALVGVFGRDLSPAYQKFCFEHAAEESGHEFMALHDLRAIGVDIDAVAASRPLPETEVLIAYLYYVSATGNPVQRLGYSFWAESVYGFIGELLAKLRADLALKPQQMSFFIAHSDIDAEHAAEVERMICQQCRTDADWEDVRRVMLTSLALTANVLTAVDRECSRLEGATRQAQEETAEATLV